MSEPGKGRKRDIRDFVYFDPDAVEDDSPRNSTSASPWSMDEQFRRSQMHGGGALDMEKALYLPVPIVQQERGGTHITVAVGEGSNPTRMRLRREDVVDVSEEATRGLADISTLDNFCEQAMLHTLRVRYAQDKIYTSVGPILISINPFKNVPGLYSEQVMAQYRRQTNAPPHVYSIAQAALSSLHKDEMSQSIIISGDSGSGKTEAAKKILSFLVNVAANNNAGTAIVSPTAATAPRKKLLDRLLHANVLLEAFGCATTINNDNSSRFGKFVEIQYDAHGLICGAKMINYLLERTRIVRQLGEHERNYHVFYELFASGDAETLRTLHLDGKTEDDFPCLLDPGAEGASHGAGRVRVEDVSLGRIRSSLGLLKINEEVQVQLFQVLAAVLHLSSMTLSPSSVDDGSVVVGDAESSLAHVAALLQLRGEDLVEALTIKTHAVRGEVFRKPQDPARATTRRDAVAKWLYASTFTWLVRTINKSISQERSQRAFIGLLDIYGFESLLENSLEQLLINYANETLQRIFNATVFEFEQEQYTAEGIDFTSVAFTDNRPTLELIENGILALLDDAWQVADAHGASDRKLLSQYHKRFGGSAAQPASFGSASKNASEAHPCYRKPRIHSDRGFVVKHYAGEVTYTCLGFCEKNREALDEDLHAALATAANPLVKAIVEAAEAREVPGGNRGRAVTLPRQGSARGESKLHGHSVSSQFKSSLRALVVSIAATRTLYVRCVKPNPRKDPDDLVPANVLLQLRYSGMFEAVRIRQQGYSARILSDLFARRFCHLDPDAADLVHLLRKLQRVLGADQDDWQLGRSRVFLKSGYHKRLERVARLRMRISVERIMRAYRHSKMRRAALRIQGWWRVAMARKMLKRAVTAARVVQACARMWKAKTLRRRRLEAAVTMQALMRGAVARRMAQQLSNPYKGQKRSAILAVKVELERELEALGVGAGEEEEAYSEEVAALKRRHKTATEAAEAIVGDPELDDVQRTGLLQDLYAAEAQLEDAEKRRDFDACAAAQQQRDDLRSKLALLPSVADLKDNMERVSRQTAKILETKGESADFLELASLRRRGSLLGHKMQEVQKERVRSGLSARIADPDDPGEWVWLSVEMRRLREEFEELHAIKEYAGCARCQRAMDRLQSVVDGMPPTEELAAAGEQAEALAEAARSKGDYATYGKHMLAYKVIEAKQQVRIDLDLDVPAAPSHPEPKSAAEVSALRASLQQQLDERREAFRAAVEAHDFARCPQLKAAAAATEAALEALPTAESLGRDIAATKAELATAMEAKDFDRCAALQPGLAAKKLLLDDMQTFEVEEAELVLEPGVEDFSAGSNSGRTTPDGPLRQSSQTSELSLLSVGTSERTSENTVGQARAQPRALANGRPERPPAGDSRKINRLRPMDPVVLLEGQSVAEATRAMVSNRQTCCLIIGERGNLVGIITDKDVSSRCVAKYLDPVTARVAEVMTTKPKFVDMDETASDALNMMIDGRFRHLPVVDQSRGGAVTGVIDIAKVLYDALKRIEADGSDDEAPGPPRRGSPTRSFRGGRPGATDDTRSIHSGISSNVDSVDEVIAAVHRAAAAGGELGHLGKVLPLLMQLRGGPAIGLSGGGGTMSRTLGSLIDPSSERPVVRHRDNVRSATQAMAKLRRAVLVEDDDGFLMGILTPNDVLKKVVDKGLNPDVTAVTSVMTENPDAAVRDTTFKDALHLMHDNRYLHIPVVAMVPGILAGPQKRALGCVDVVEIMCAAFGRKPPAAKPPAVAVAAASTYASSYNVADSRGGGGGGSDNTSFFDKPPSVFSDAVPRSGIYGNSPSPVQPFGAGFPAASPPPLLPEGLRQTSLRGPIDYGADPVRRDADADSDASYNPSVFSGGLGYSASTVGAGYGKVPFKVIFPAKNKKHRFHASVSSLNEVLEAIRERASMDAGTDLLLQYIDDEDDHVEIRTDDDLKVAVEVALVQQRQKAVHIIATVADAAGAGSQARQGPQKGKDEGGSVPVGPLQGIVDAAVGVTGLTPDVVVGVGIGVGVVAVLVGLSMLVGKKNDNVTYAVPRARHMYVRR